MSCLYKKVHKNMLLVRPCLDAHIQTPQQKHSIILCCYTTPFVFASSSELRYYFSEFFTHWIYLLGNTHFKLLQGPVWHCRPTIKLLMLFRTQVQVWKAVRKSSHSTYWQHVWLQPVPLSIIFHQHQILK